MIYVVFLYYTIKPENLPELRPRRFLAGVAGFEPTNAGVKVLCLTAWRHPNILFIASTTVLFYHKTAPLSIAFE